MNLAVQLIGFLKQPPNSPLNFVLDKLSRPAVQPSSQLRSNFA